MAVVLNRTAKRLAIMTESYLSHYHLGDVGPMAAAVAKPPRTIEDNSDQSFGRAQTFGTPGSRAHPQCPCPKSIVPSEPVKTCTSPLVPTGEKRSAFRRPTVAKLVSSLSSRRSRARWMEPVEATDISRCRTSRWTRAEVLGWHGHKLKQGDQRVRVTGLTSRPVRTSRACHDAAASAIPRARLIACQEARRSAHQASVKARSSIDQRYLERFAAAQACSRLRSRFRASR